MFDRLSRTFQRVSRVEFREDEMNEKLRVILTCGLASNSHALSTVEDNATQRQACVATYDRRYLDTGKVTSFGTKREHYSVHGRA